MTRLCSIEGCQNRRGHYKIKDDLKGRRFGRLEVVAYLPALKPGGRRLLHCKCDCGGEIKVLRTRLIEGHTQSCGCLRTERATAALVGRNTTHSSSYSTEYNSWQSAKQRCTNPRSHKYAEYGGRGIRMCDEWLSDFAAFLQHMGRKPNPRWSIDRIDTDGHYEPGNCRWASTKTQINNRRATIRVVWEGLVMPLSEACRLSGVPYPTAWKRLNRGDDWLTEK